MHGSGAQGCTEKAPPATDRTDEAETESPPPASDTDEDAGETGEAESSRCSAWGAPDVVATVSDPELDEISGLVVSRRHAGVLWVHEDSGAGPVLTALSTDGASLATLTLRDASSVDWEDLAIAPCGEADCLWVGDFGDNSERRTDVQLLRIQEPDLSVVGGALEASVTAYPYAYTEGPQDAEALVVTSTGQPYVLTKRTDATCHLPSTDKDSTIAERVATISTGTTDGLRLRQRQDLWPDGTDSPCEATCSSSAPPSDQRVSLGPTPPHTRPSPPVWNFKGRPSPMTLSVRRSGTSARA